MTETAKEHSNPPPQTGAQRIGELADASGLTVRTLHYYEEIGLLVPAERTGAGHRLYKPTEVDRLYRILLLRRLGLSLENIGKVLDDPDWDIRSAFTAHLESIEQQLEAGKRLRSHLSRLVSATGSEQPTTNDLIEVVEDIAMTDNTTGVRERISILVYEDLEAAGSYLTRVFGFGPADIHRDGEGTPVLVTLDAGDGVLWLHRETPEFNLASPKTLGATSSMMAVMVEDVDAHHAHTVSEGATIVYEPVDQPYGYREYGARDLEGGLWSFMKPLA